MKSILCFVAVIIFNVRFLAATDLKLWYDRPAKEWTEALPLGNSKLAAMLYGDVVNEELQINEETFWSGSPYNNLNPNALKNLSKIRQLVFAGKSMEAQTLLDSTFLTPHHGMRYLPLGSIHLGFRGHEKYTD